MQARRRICQKSEQVIAGQIVSKVVKHFSISGSTTVVGNHEHTRRFGTDTLKAPGSPICFLSHAGPRCLRAPFSVSVCRGLLLGGGDVGWRADERRGMLSFTWEGDMNHESVAHHKRSVGINDSADSGRNNSNLTFRRISPLHNKKKEKKPEKDLVVCDESFNAFGKAMIKHLPLKTVWRRSFMLRCKIFKNGEKLIKPNAVGEAQRREGQMLGPGKKTAQ